MKFINFELNMIGVDPLSNIEIIDSLVLARNKFPGAQNSLDALCRRFDVDLSKRTKHGALLDSELLADIYIELMGGAQGGLNLVAKDQSEKQIQEMKILQAKNMIESRNFKVSDDDLKKHQEFIAKNFKSNLWYIES